MKRKRRRSPSRGQRTKVTGHRSERRRHKAKGKARGPRMRSVTKNQRTYNKQESGEHETPKKRTKNSSTVDFPIHSAPDELARTEKIGQRARGGVSAFGCHAKIVKSQATQKSGTKKKEQIRAKKQEQRQRFSVKTTRRKAGSTKIPNIEKDSEREKQHHKVIITMTSPHELASVEGSNGGLRVVGAIP
ncbi:hypothetical protein GALMADRAFT_281236 [Galerina marginata CBS 339.88]|uniref:Uncharacterized protein n=1 Tax=Galerina marginata (strain CBS 339.88) TaxID=685588 RepID=A0A067SSP0_GALM3|nr:hypothetical protein GALMADRAFT_281236 [Galerina marginata CBS 339.88]